MKFPLIFGEANFVEVPGIRKFMALKIRVLYSDVLWSAIYKHSHISLNTQFKQSSVSWILINWII